jgi:hypothetical protein
MAEISVYNFILALLGNIGYLFITISLLLFFITIVELVGKMKILDINEKQKFRKISIGFFILGYFIIIFPQNVDLDGYVKDSDGNGQAGINVKIGKIVEMTNDKGHYLLPNVPLNASSISYEARGGTCEDELKINKWMASFLGLIHLPYSITPKILRRDNYTVHGYIIDELGAHVAGANIFDSRSASVKPLGISDMDGYFQFNITCDLTDKPELKVYHPRYADQTDVQFQKLCFTRENASTRDKEITISYPTKGTLISVCGYVFNYDGRIDKDPVPIIGAEVEIDGQSNFTDCKGYYIINHIRRRVATNYSVILRNGAIYNRKIKPSLMSEDNSIHIAQRNIWLP